MNMLYEDSGHRNESLVYIMTVNITSQKGPQYAGKERKYLSDQTVVQTFLHTATSVFKKMRSAEYNATNAFKERL